MTTKTEKRPAEIIIPQVLDVSFKTKRDKEEGIITQITFDVKTAPGDLARLLNMMRQNAKLELTISTRQLEMDLEVTMAKLNLE